MMEIVIKIPEKEFGIDIEDKFQDFFKRLEVEAKDHMICGTNLLCGAYELETIQMFMQALANGTLLPKGHGDLVDASKIQFKNTDFDTYGDYCRAFDAIDQADTIIEADKEK
jgi:hypothetical protein